MLHDRTYRLSLALARKGINEAALARLLGVTAGSFWEIKNGRSPGHLKWPQIAAALEVPIEWLKDGDQSQAPAWAKTGTQIANEVPVVGVTGTGFASVPLDQLAAQTAEQGKAYQVGQVQKSPGADTEAVLLHLSVQMSNVLRTVNELKSEIFSLSKQVKDLKSSQK